MTAEAGAARRSREPSLPGRAATWNPRELGRPASLMLLIGLATCGLLLLARRGASAAQPLTPALLPPAALALALLAFLARRLARTATPGPPTLARRVLLPATTSASLLLVGLALGAAEPPWWAALTFWAIVALEESWAWGREAVVERNSLRSDSRQNSLPSVESPATLASQQAEAERQRITQEYMRASLGDGRELVRGTLHLVVADGARTATAHVAFCPPFAERPKFDVRLTAGPPCRVKLGQLLPQGARIEIKLHAPVAVSERLSLEFTAHGQGLLS